MNIVERARSAVGARFRLHGREAATGLDCVGLAALAYGEAAVAAVDVRAGDLLLCASGPGQLHLAIDSGGGVIHADAMLRRVVERPGPVPWTVIGRWRLKGED
ncbi:hypothetical protein [Sphingomonas sp. CCH10-B3]|uniref:hypothetical protein n=1 Tax=Sphingomonas sp. CCH10-B3 TaxID=1768757 RepID=UPI000835822C|nr:hypothetical protein [Sphingomonas sp. CCH10-B3]